MLEEWKWSSFCSAYFGLSSFFGLASCHAKPWSDGRFYEIWVRSRVAQEPKRNRFSRRNRVFPETESGTGTVFQELSKTGTEPGTGTVLSCETVLKHRETHFAEEPKRNRKPEPLEPFHPQTVTEPNRGLSGMEQETRGLQTHRNCRIWVSSRDFIQIFHREIHANIKDQATGATEDGTTCSKDWRNNPANFP